MEKYLRLNLDEMFGDEYYYTEYDVGDSGHSITIKASDKEAFLNAFAAEWRKCAEAALWERPFEGGD